jgi:hypothetical protein
MTGELLRPAPVLAFREKLLRRRQEDLLAGLGLDCGGDLLDQTDDGHGGVGLRGSGRSRLFSQNPQQLGHSVHWDFLRSQMGVFGVGNPDLPGESGRFSWPFVRGGVCRFWTAWKLLGREGFLGLFALGWFFVSLSNPFHTQ